MAGFFSGGDAGAPRAWTDAAQAVYMAQGWLNFENPGLDGICSDGKRMGIPSEECSVYAVFSRTADAGMWMIPQAKLWGVSL